jgi:MFS family permease
MATESLPAGQKAASADPATLNHRTNGTAVLDPVTTLPETVDERAEESTRRRFSSLKTFDSFQEISFRWYFASMVGWFASMQMQMLVRGWIVYDLTGSYAALGLVSLANAIPGMVLSLPGGVLADRLAKKKIIQVGQICNTSVAAVLASLMLADVLVFWHLLACAVVQGSTNALIMPARQSMIPEIVDGDRLMNAVALNSAAMNFMRIAGVAVGGLLLTTLGPGWVYMTMAGLYFSGAILLTPVRTRKIERVKDETEKGESSGLRDIAEGARYIWRDKTVLLILTITLMIVLFSMPYQILLAGFVKDVLDAGAGGLTILTICIGIGSLSSSLVIATLPGRNRGLVFLLSSLLLGVSLILFSISSWFWVTAIILLVLGVGQSGRMSLSNVLLQSYTADQYRGRVMSIYMLEFSLVPFGTFLVGIAANIVGVQVALGATSLALVVVVLGALLLSPRMRQLQ